MKQENTPTASASDAEDRQLLNELAVDDVACAMKIGADVVSQIKEICGQIVRGEVNATAIKTIMAGVTHDDDVRNAEGEGYLRGKNEKIELENRFDQDAEKHAARNGLVPRFVRRSIWDITD
ncbi:MAG: hypothetical protein ACI4AH_01140 [Muribaculaceae bacterium]